MRSAFILAALMFSGAQAFAGDDPAILVCEAALKSALKSPKSYERVSADISGARVYLTYDAVNSFNAPLRGRHLCEFQRFGSQFGFSFGAAAPDSEDELIRRADMELAAGATGLYPVSSTATSLR